MIEAKVVEDSIYEGGKRLVTMQLKYQRFIHAELMTHRVFSRNASSSRAIPVAKMLQQVYEEPAMPVEWGKNQPGMQSRELLSAEDTECAKSSWLAAAKMAAGAAEALMETGVHKQIANRLLEPFQWIHVVVTATEWDNFFALRDHPDAQPEIRELARAMKAAMVASTPRQLGDGEWHLPYVLQPERETLSLAEQIACSVARCARVSYLRHDHTMPTLINDVDLHDKLVLANPPHMSPTEHQATPTMDTGKEANLRGWMQYRRQIEMGETECRP
jgi:hypothetical protein